MRDNYGISAGLNRTAGQQAAYQLLALVITLGIAIVSGLITGNHFFFLDHPMRFSNKLHNFSSISTYY